MPLLPTSKKVSLKRETALRKEGFSQIAGVDEAGRGPLAGPVVAAACILPIFHALSSLFPRLNDSKKLSQEQRDLLYAQLTSHPDVIYGIGEASVEEIDTLNIHHATLRAMQRAVDALATPPDYVLIDGKYLPPWTLRSEAIIGGDGQVASIAAASILAKVTRDRKMEEYHKAWPQYGFAQHKGYPTAAHRAAILKWGRSPLHRTSFDFLGTDLE